MRKMKSTKKLLRQRLLDIGIGSGHWGDQDEGDYFWSGDLDAFGRFLNAVMGTLPGLEFGVYPISTTNLGAFQSLNDLTECLWGRLDIKEMEW